MRACLLALLALSACTDKGGDTDTSGPCTEVDWYTDSDGDGFGKSNAPISECEQPEGYAAESGDCSDDNADVHPGASEVCDSLDNDCDGRVDDADDQVIGATQTFRDGDDDGHGDPETSATLCHPPDNYVDSSDDCDDDEATVYPGAPEVCDTLDNDCDGDADDADDDVTDAPTWYADADGDLYGDAAVSTVLCVAPDGYVADGTDCDDALAQVYPGAPEVCDELDDNCDDLVDDQDPALTGAPTWYADADMDGFGDPGAPTDACIAPAGTLADATDCDDTAAAVFPGAIEVCNGLDDNCDALVDLADPALDLSTSFAAYTDADADGHGDPALAVVVCALEAGVAAAGDDCDDATATTYPGAPDRCGDAVDADCDGVIDTCTALADLGVALTAEQADDQAGYTFAPAGDFTGDGVADLVVDSRFGHRVSKETGTLYVVAGPITAGMSLLDATLAVDGEADGDRTGNALATGQDLDGDGLTDVLFGVSGSDRNSSAGAAAVVLGGTSGKLDLTAASLILEGAAGGDGFGFGVALPGDLTGDGVADLLVGADAVTSGASGAGMVYGWSSLPTGTVSASTSDFTLAGVAADEEAGRTLGAPGDLDGDGVMDLAVGATEASGPGGVYIVLGPVSGATSLADAAAHWAGESSSGDAGTSLAAAGDVDGDGNADLLVGDPEATSLGTQTGAAYLLSGPALDGDSLADATLVMRGEGSGSQAGLGVGTAGDLDGDGRTELLIGAPHDPASVVDAGVVYVVRGSRSGVLPLGLADLLLVGPMVNSDAGWSVGGVGDIDGDGLPDFGVGAPVREDGATGGSLLLVLGLTLAE